MGCKSPHTRTARPAASREPEPVLVPVPLPLDLDLDLDLELDLDLDNWSLGGLWAWPKASGSGSF